MQRRSAFQAHVEQLLEGAGDMTPTAKASTLIHPVWKYIQIAAVGDVTSVDGQETFLDLMLIEFEDLSLQVWRKDIRTIHLYSQPNATLVYAYMVLLQVCLNSCLLT